MKRTWQTLGLMAVLLGAATAQGAPKAALFVQNRAGAQLESRLDAFNDLVSTRLADAGFEVIRYQDALDRFVESRRAEDAQVLRQFAETLQTAKAEATVDGPSREASALRTAQLMGADYLVFASLVSLGENKLNVQAYGTTQQQTVTTLRVALRILEGAGGAQVYGDTIVVSEKIAQNAFAQVEAGDLVDTLLDRGAVELASRVGDSRAKLEAARAAAPALASVKVTTPEAGAAVEVDGVVVGTTPGAFQIRPGVHEVRVSKEGYATWEKSVAFADGMELSVPLELSAVGLDRKGELEAQAIAREQSEADAFATKTVAGGTAQASSNSFIRLEGMPNESLTLGGDADGDGGGAAAVNVIQQEIK